MNYTVHGILWARILEWLAFPFFRVSSQPRVRPRSPTLQVDSLPAEPQGKPKNTGVGSLSLSPADLPNPAIEAGSPALKADSLPTELSGRPNRSAGSQKARGHSPNLTNARPMPWLYRTHNHCLHLLGSHILLLPPFIRHVFQKALLSWDLQVVLWSHTLVQIVCFSS